jgi:hypothetical protein
LLDTIFTCLQTLGIHWDERAFPKTLYFIIPEGFLENNVFSNVKIMGVEGSPEEERVVNAKRY